MAEPFAPHVVERRRRVWQVDDVAREKLLLALTRLYTLDEYLASLDAGDARAEARRTVGLLWADVVDMLFYVDSTEDAYAAARREGRREALLEAENLVHGETWTRLHAIPR
jgi:hypothetical protein